MASSKFRATAAQRLSEERDLSPSILSLLAPNGDSKQRAIRQIDVEQVDTNPGQPRMIFDQETLDELTASVRQHGVLQPVLVRPMAGGRFQLIAGERRWRASRAAKLETIPAIIEDIDDDTALEIAIIENLQREDLSPLDEALMYQRMTRDHGYSLRKLAQKLGKDKGYIENRLRLADAPNEVKQLVSLRKDTVSHAYELMKIEDPKRRRRLAEQVARGELSLMKLRDRVEGRRTRPATEALDPTDPALDETERDEASPMQAAVTPTVDPVPYYAIGAWTGSRPADPINDESLVSAKAHLSEALEELVSVLRSPDALSAVGEVDRSNLAKYLTISKLKLENAIAVLRSGTAAPE